MALYPHLSEGANARRAVCVCMGGHDVSGLAQCCAVVTLVHVLHVHCRSIFGFDSAGRHSIRISPCCLSAGKLVGCCGVRTFLHPLILIFFAGSPRLIQSRDFMRFVALGLYLSQTMARLSSAFLRGISRLVLLLLVAVPALSVETSFPGEPCARETFLFLFCCCRPTHVAFLRYEAHTKLTAGFCCFWLVPFLPPRSH